MLSWDFLTHFFAMFAYDSLENIRNFWSSDLLRFSRGSKGNIRKKRVEKIWLWFWKNSQSLLKKNLFILKNFHVLMYLRLSKRRKDRHTNDVFCWRICIVNWFCDNSGSTPCGCDDPYCFGKWPNSIQSKFRLF